MQTDTSLCEIKVKHTDVFWVLSVNIRRKTESLDKSESKLQIC